MIDVDDEIEYVGEMLMNSVFQSQISITMQHNIHRTTHTHTHTHTKTHTTHMRHAAVLRDQVVKTQLVLAHKAHGKDAAQHELIQVPVEQQRVVVVFDCGVQAARDALARGL